MAVAFGRWFRQPQLRHHSQIIQRRRGTGREMRATEFHLQLCELDKGALLYEKALFGKMDLLAPAACWPRAG
jgi:hypothetical protein